MNLSKVIIINSLYALFGAVVMIFMPAQIMQPYGVVLENGGVFIAGLFGAGLLGYAILYYMLRNTKDKETVRVLSITAVIVHLVSALVAIMAILANTVNSMTWVDTILHVLLALGFWQYGLNRK